METTLKACYNKFISNVMKSMGLPIEEMQTFGEWIENRKADFEYQMAVGFISKKQINDGFESWLTQMYA